MQKFGRVKMKNKKHNKNSKSEQRREAPERDNCRQSSLFNELLNLRNVGEWQGIKTKLDKVCTFCLGSLHGSLHFLHGLAFQWCAQ
jgi:hypothetical protein